MEIVAELRSREDTVKKAAAALGLNAPTAEDVIRREDYPDDITYTIALARMQKEMDSPEFRAAMRKTGVAVQQQNEEADRERQREEFRRIRKGVTLDELDQQNIDAEAERLAKKDLADGKIKASQYSDTILRHAEKLTERAKDSKAQSRQFNDMIRQQIRRGQIE